MQTMRRHKVTARHGDAFDPLSFEGDRDLSGLTDAITLDLVGRFVIEVEQKLGHELPDAAILALREIDNFRPLLLVPAWIEGLLERTCPQPAVRKRVKQLWDRLAEELLSSRLVRERDAFEFGEPHRRTIACPAVQQTAFGRLDGGHGRMAADDSRGRVAIPLPVMP